MHHTVVDGLIFIRTHSAHQPTNTQNTQAHENTLGHSFIKITRMHHVHCPPAPPLHRLLIHMVRWVVVCFCFSLRFKYSIITDNQMLMIHSHYITASAQPLFGFMTNDAFRVSGCLFTTTNVCSSDFFVNFSKRVHNGES